MRYLLVLILLLAPASAAAQDTYRGWTKTTVGTSAPGTCSDGEIFINSTLITMQMCIAGVWRSPMPPIVGNNGKFLKANGDGPEWADAPSGSLPSGAIIAVLTSSCPTGFTEATEFSGRVALGTTIAAGNAGTTGGNDNITPAGTVAQPTFTGTPITQVINHMHPLATGTGSTGNFSQVIGTVDASSGGTGGSPTQTALGTVSGNPSGGVASITPAGTVSQPAFTGTQFDNRSAFVRVVWCKAN